MNVVGYGVSRNALIGRIAVYLLIANKTGNKEEAMEELRSLDLQPRFR